ncbi:MAG: hypothetical protein KDC92_10410 [Bacteroidetes bacterium]|nr:hypothetical protein [Bacteroidota bacterium]
MNITLRTKVNGHYMKVMQGFDRNLFEALAPPFPKFSVEAFTGSETGDKVDVKFGWPLNSHWKSDITSHGQNEQETWFVDEGTEMPFGLKKWHHRHVVKKISETESEIIDDMTFKAGNRLASLLLYVPLLFAFLPRKGKYKRYFKDY